MNTKQTEALKLALEALMEATKIHASSCKCSVCRAVIITREALAEQPAQQQQEPVAWMRHDGERVTTAADRKNYPDYETRYPIPLYTSPPASKPLTDEQRNWIVATCPTPRHIIDTVEKMHNIKE